MSATFPSPFSSSAPADLDAHSIRSARALCLLLALLVLLGLPAAPLLSQTPDQKAVEELTGTGDDGGGADQHADGPSADKEGEKEPGIFPEAPPEPAFLRQDLLKPKTWERLADEMLSELVRWLPSFVAAGLILVAFFFLNRLAAGMLGRVITKAGAEPAVQEIALRLTKYTIIAVGLVMAASQLGIQVASLLAGLGVVGLAIGLAAQDTLANLVAGITILWDRPFRIGDNVTVTGTFGKVEEIGLRTTRIRTVEQLDTILPNKEIINATIVNHTLNPMMRLAIPVGIGYGEDTREARRVLLDKVSGHALILDDPAPQVVVTALGDSAVDLELRVWLRDPFAEREATCVMTELAKVTLDEAGIEIPFPQRTLHFAEPLDVRTGAGDDAADDAAGEVAGAPGASGRGNA